MSKLNSLFTKLGITPSNEGLFEEALTHSSYKTKDKDAHDYETVSYTHLGAQGVLLAPTESLAKQHYETLLSFFKDFDLRIELLIGALTPSVKTKLKEDIQHGLVDIVVGTHALFSEDVFYPKLELVVIDEQHKFGVNQRNTLLNKGEKADLLLLSATPIPRTLANVIYGDMDISTIESFPHTGRQVNTIITTSASKNVIPLIDCLLYTSRCV